MMTDDEHEVTVSFAPTPVMLDISDSDIDSEFLDGEDADDGASEATETTETDDTTEKVAVTGDEVEEEKPEEEVADLEQPEPEAKSGWDKGLQKTQQRVSGLDAKIDRLSDLVSKFVEAGQTTATQAGADSADKAEEQAADIEAILSTLDFDAGSDEEDLVTAGDFKALSGKIKAVLGSVSAPTQASPEGVEDKLNKILAFMDNQKAKDSAAKEWGDFKSKHGFDGEPLWSEALSEAETLLPGSNEVGALAVKLFDRKVESYQPETKVPTKPAKKKIVKPASSETPSSTRGTQTTRPGATKTTNRKASQVLPPVWTPD